MVMRYERDAMQREERGRRKRVEVEQVIDCMNAEEVLGKDVFNFFCEKNSEMSVLYIQ